MSKLTNRLRQGRIQRQNQRTAKTSATAGPNVIAIEAGGYSTGQRQATPVDGGEIAIDQVVGGSAQPAGAIGLAVRVGTGWFAVW